MTLDSWFNDNVRAFKDGKLSLDMIKSESDKYGFDYDKAIGNLSKKYNLVGDSFSGVCIMSQLNACGYQSPRRSVKGGTMSIASSRQCDDIKKLRVRVGSLETELRLANNKVIELTDRLADVECQELSDGKYVELVEEVAKLADDVCDKDAALAEIEEDRDIALDTLNQVEEELAECKVRNKNMNDEFVIERRALKKEVAKQAKLVSEYKMKDDIIERRLRGSKSPTRKSPNRK